MSPLSPMAARDSQRGAFLSRGVLRPAGKVDKEETWHKDLTRSALPT